jgi:hypothetical protein
MNEKLPMEKRLYELFNADAIMKDIDKAIKSYNDDSLERLVDQYGKACITFSASAMMIERDYGVDAEKVYHDYVKLKLLQECEEASRED